MMQGADSSLPSIDEIAETCFAVLSSGGALDWSQLQTRTGLVVTSPEDEKRLYEGIIKLHGPKKILGVRLESETGAYVVEIANPIRAFFGQYKDLSCLVEK